MLAWINGCKDDGKPTFTYHKTEHERIKTENERHVDCFHHSLSAKIKGLLIEKKSSFVLAVDPIVDGLVITVAS